MRNIIRKFLGRTYYPLNRVEINKKNLISNYLQLSKISNKIKIAPVLKSNAYGHGLLAIAKIVDEFAPPFICVDSLYEAYELYMAKIKSKILIMGYIDPENLKVKKLPFSYAVYDLKLLEVINKYQKGAGVHIKVDTGMNRLGIKINDLEAFFTQLRNFPDITVEGIMSHFASAGNGQDEAVKLQLRNFNKALSLAKKFAINFKLSHIASSSSLLNLDSNSLEKVSNLARVGLALYGINGENTKVKLKPVLSLKSRIVQIKDLVIGEKVGYNGTFKAIKPMKIGLLPLGYNDAIDRRLSNKGVVLVNGKQCKIVGMVSMNITGIDLTNVDSAKEDDEVTVISNNSKDANSISNLAKTANTIPYDILVRISSSIRREVI